MFRKGISPIVASVLLVAVSISVVAVFSGWAPNLAKTVTEETTNTTVETLECDSAAVSVESAFYNTSSTSGDLSVAVRNTDRANLPQLIVAAFDQNELIMKQTEMNLSSGDFNDTKINSLSQEPSYVQVFSKSCGNVEDRLDTINSGQ